MQPIDRTLTGDRGADAITKLVVGVCKPAGRRVLLDDFSTNGKRV